MENKIFITDDNGKEVEMNVLLTFSLNEGTKDEKEIAVVYPDDNEDELYALSYDEDGNMYTIDNEEELAQIQEVIDAFDGIDDNEEEKKD